MKKIITCIFFLCLLFNLANAIEDRVCVYQDGDKYGLILGEEKITPAKYSKLISLRDESYIFMYKNKFGIISKTGEILVEPVYTSAQRFIGKYAKLGKSGNYVLYDEKGDKIVDDDYSDIALLYGRMFLVKKNYKYGLVSFNGDIILAPIADDIYMPKANVLKILFDNEWYEISQIGKDTLELPNEILTLQDDNKNFTITKIVEKPVVSAGYGVVSASDYVIKIISSISPAYEQTIDELILSHGADTASILMKSSWIAKFPYVYVKNYINTFKTPNNGPLADVKSNLKNKINN